ncbi:uncharacterized protein [Typha latifolia]|uniref:uncharacterized protein isoform X2 n=1 Tax=Typha latifolia TaxID=4733 RepID=UPI003C2EE23D
MDAKKKKNRKKKGNQGKIADDAASNAEEVVVRDLNNDSALQPNHHGQNSDNVDVQSVVGVSESDMELEKHKMYEAKFVRLHEVIKQLEDEKNLWLQKEINLEEKLERLQSKVDFCLQNTTFLEEKLNKLQVENDSLVQEEAILADKVKSIEGIKDSWTLKETSIRETISELEEVNRTLKMQVKELEESRSTVVKENQSLCERLSTVESRIENLETRTVSEETTEADGPKLNGLDSKQDQSALASEHLSRNEHGHYQSALVAEPFSRYELDEVVTVARASTPTDHGQEYGANMLESESIQSSIQVQQMLSNDQVGGSDDGSMQAAKKQRSDEPMISEEIVTVLDEIQIHEEESQGAAVDMKPEEVPLSDAPLIGAPFRLISFVAKFVSGADLVNQAHPQSSR